MKGSRIVVLAVLPLLSGCAGLAVAGAGAAAIGHGKTPVDQVVSWVEGKHCSEVRANQGLTYCVEDEVSPVYTGHCFQTLGGVTCYREANPYPGHQVPIGGNSTVARASRVARPPEPSSPLAPTPSKTN